MPTDTMPGEGDMAAFLGFLWLLWWIAGLASLMLGKTVMHEIMGVLLLSFGTLFLAAAWAVESYKEAMKHGRK
jgi:hypothetical protein